MDYAISNHAKIEMQHRGISMECAHNVMTKPDQIMDSYGQRKIYQSRLLMDSKDWIVHLIVEEWHSSQLDITAYRTSKISKYWSEQ